jgi:hypothetical protein
MKEDATEARRRREVAQHLISCANAITHPTGGGPTGPPVEEEAAYWMREAARLLDPLLDDDVYYALTL